MKGLGLEKIEAEKEKQNSYKYFGMLSFVDRVLYPGWKANFGFSLLITACLYILFIRFRFKNKYLIAFLAFSLLYYFFSRLSKNLRK